MCWDQGKCRMQWEPISRGHGNFSKTSTETWRVKKFERKCTGARKCTDLGSAPSGPGMCFLLQQYLDGTDPRTPLPPASNHPPTFCPVTTFGTSHSTIPSLQDQLTPFFKFNSLLLINHELPDSSECLHQGGGPVHHSVNLHLHASCTYLSLGFYFHRTMWIWRAWASFSINWPRRSMKAPSISLKFKIRAASVPSSKSCRSLPKMSRQKPRSLWKPPNLCKRT